jgi:ribonuclease J
MDSAGSPVCAAIAPLRHRKAGVGHSIAGACAFLIETEERRLVYTGDLRFHGRKPGIRSAFLKVCRKTKLDLTITERTALSRPGSEAFLTESGVEEVG